MEDASDEPPQRSSSIGTIEIIDPDQALDHAARNWLETYAARAAAELGIRGSVRARLVSDAEMSFAHEKYKGEPGPTDVLTFDLSEPGRPLDVDLLVCTDEAARHAEALGHAQLPELLLYIVHGVLHCLGHDDVSEAAADRMHQEEDRVLRAIGVGPVYQPEDGAR